MAKHHFVVWLAILGWCIFVGTSWAQDTKGPVPASTIRTQLAQGSFQTMVEELGKLPTAERLRWLSEFSAVKGLPRIERSIRRGAIANYDDLIRLIETSIDADWANNGGTATMTPFRQEFASRPKGSWNEWMIMRELRCVYVRCSVPRYRWSSSEIGNNRRFALGFPASAGPYDRRADSEQ